MDRLEIGIHRVTLTQAAPDAPVFSLLPQTIPTVQWHGAEVKTLPVNSVMLAGNDHCPIQAMRVGPHAYGVQYHAEVDKKTLQDRSTVDEYRIAIEAVNGPGAQDIFDRSVQFDMLALTKARTGLYERFVKTVLRSKSQQGYADSLLGAE